MIRVLVADDQEIVRAGFAALLDTQEDFEVAGTAADGDEAVSLCREQHPDVVLMDIQLKGEMDGIQAAQRIQNSLGIPVVYLTAHSDSDTLKRVIHSKSYGYLVKPITEDALKEAIDKALSRHRGTTDTGRLPPP